MVIEEEEKHLIDIQGVCKLVVNTKQKQTKNIPKNLLKRNVDSPVSRLSRVSVVLYFYDKICSNVVKIHFTDYLIFFVFN